MVEPGRMDGVRVEAREKRGKGLGRVGQAKRGGKERERRGRTFNNWSSFFPSTLLTIDGGEVSLPSPLLPDTHINLPFSFFSTADCVLYIFGCRRVLWKGSENE